MAYYTQVFNGDTRACCCTVSYLSLQLILYISQTCYDQISPAPVKVRDRYALHCICALQRHSWVLPNRQHSRSTACALLSDNGYLLIQAFFQALQSYSWGFALIQSLSKHVMIFQRQ